MAYNTPLTQVRSQLQRYARPSLRPTAITQSQRELRPYVQAEQEKRRKKRSWLQPIQAIFDVLQRGQYTTANIAQQITRNVREGQPILSGVGREAWEGLRGKQKGDWANVLFGGKDVGGEEFEGIFRNADKEKWEKPILGEKFKGKVLLGATPRGLAGFAANVLFDPTSYLPGPLKASKAVSKKFAADKAILAIKELSSNPALLKEIMGEGAEEFAQKLGKAAVENAPQALKMVEQTPDVARYLERVVREQRKRGLRLPEKALKEEVLKQIEPLQKPLKESVEKAVSEHSQKLASEFAEKGLGEMSSQKMVGELGEQFAVSQTSKTGLRYLDDLAKSVESGRYGGAGQRGFSLLGVPFGKSERYPQLLKSWDQITKSIGGTFSNAWWSVMNKGPIGQLKTMFNVRNPYQEIVAQLVLDAASMETNARNAAYTGIKSLVRGLGPDDAKAVRDIMIQTQGQVADFRTLATQMGVKGDSVEKVALSIENINRVTENWRKQLQQWADEGFIKDIGDIENYLPIRFKKSPLTSRMPASVLGAKNPTFTMTREAGWKADIATEAAKWKYLFPEISPQAATALVMEGGKGGLETDLFSMLLGRAMGQARLEKRVNLIRQIREMGFNLKQAAATAGPNTPIQQIAGKSPKAIQQLGLEAIDDIALDGYLFDKDIVKYFVRAVEATRNDESIQLLEKLATSFTSWWKGWATASPGFHFRNHYSNNMTGFIKHGMSWFNAKDNFEAWAGVVGALSNKNALDDLIGAGIDEASAKMLLSKRLPGGLSNEELWRYARQHGVISLNVMGADAPKSMKEMVGKGKTAQMLDPTSRNFAALQAGYKVSTYVENVSRYHSFLLDYKQAVAQGASTETALEWAKLEAKKWFVDYGDLSPLEQKVLKNVIPFYTWIRKNIANQIQGMMEFKNMYTMYPKMFKAPQGLEGTEMPEWMVQAGYIPMGEEDGQVTTFWPNLAIQDVNKLPLKFVMTEAGIPVPKWAPEEALHDIASNAHPLLKTYTELVGKRDVWTGRELDENLPAPRMLRMAANSPKLLEWLDGFFKAVGFDRGIDPDIDEDGRLTINPLVAKALENNILFLKRIPQYWDMPEVIFPALERIKHDVKSVGDYEKADQQIDEIFSILSFYAGVKYKKFDVEKEKQYEALGVMREAEKERTRDRKKMPGYQTRKSNTLKQNLIRARKTGAFGG